MQKETKKTTTISLADIIKQNEALGFLFVHCSKDMNCIWKKKNEVGEWTYYSDRIGNEGAMPILNTAFLTIEEMGAIYKDMKTTDPEVTAESERLIIKSVNLIASINEVSAQTAAKAMLSLEWSRQARTFLIKYYNL